MISAVKWASKDPSSNQCSYKFEYDGILRLKNAMYAQKTIGVGSSANVSGFDEKNISYDHNGNILTLKRNAILNNVITPVDDLNYSYNGNQLSNMTDGTGGSYNQVGFKNLRGSTAVYEYTTHGSLCTDLKIRQENSYYPFGLVMPGSEIATPTAANLKLYNGEAEGQNDFSNLPDYYNTYYRNYDPAIGRFTGVDPKVELSDSWTPYNYCCNNPVMYNDPFRG